MFSSPVSIHLGGAVTNSAVGVHMVHLTLVTETEKAIELSDGKYSIWLPKRALRPSKGDDPYYKLAHWFKPSSFQDYVLNRTSRTSVISA